MIRKIKFNNFYSFGEEQEISFLTNKKKTYDYYNSKNKESEQITKVAGFVGGNASGKTNIMRLFGFLGFFVCVGTRDTKNIKNDVGFKTFFNNEKRSSFYVEFEVNSFIYFYDVTIKRNKILEEVLSRKDVSKKTRIGQIFHRKNNKIVFLSKNYFKDFPKKGLDNIRDDVSLISYIKSNYNVDIINKVFGYFYNIHVNVNEIGELNNIFHKIGSVDMYIDDKELKKEMEEFVRRFDLGLKSFEIDNKKRTPIFGVHDLGGESKKIDFPYESSGTRSIFHMFAYLSDALKNNSVVIIDELETGMHPEAVSKIISYFIDENELGKAQLIFSSHSLDFMKKFDMQQIFMVDKDKDLNSFAYRLDGVEGVRTDENFLAKYMSGAYGAFPDIKV